MVHAMNMVDTPFQVLSTVKHQLLSTKDESLKLCTYPRAQKYEQWGYIIIGILTLRNYFK